MSLLNDALRKKQQEQLSASPPPDKLGMSPPSRKRTRGRRQVAILLVLGLMLGGLLLADHLLTTPPLARHPQPQKPAGATAGATAGAIVPPSAPKPTVAPAKPVPEPVAVRSSAPRRSPAPTLRQSTAIVAPSTPVSLPTPQVAQESPTQPTPSEVLPAQLAPFLAKAQALQREGRFGEAADFYRSILLRVPQHHESLFGLTECLLEEHRYEEALGHAAQLSRQLPENPRAWLDLALCDIGLAENTSALVHLDKSRDLGGYPFATALNRGIALTRLGRFVEAQAAYQSAEELQPGSQTLMFNRALAFDKSGQFAEAVVYYQRYLRTPGGENLPQSIKVESRVAALRRSLNSTDSAAE